MLAKRVLLTCALAFGGLVALAACTSTETKPGGTASGNAAGLEATVIAKATAGIFNTPVPTRTTPPEEAEYEKYPPALHMLTFHPDDPHRMWVSFGPELVALDITEAGAKADSDRLVKTNGPLVFTFIYPKGGDALMGGQGLFKRSVDEGRTWTDVASLQKVDIEGLVADPRSPHTLTALVGGRGVLKSTDNGETWEPQSTTVPDGAFGLWVTRADPLRLATFDHTANHLLASDDGGKTWTPLLAKGLGERPYQIALEPDGRALAGTDSGLFISRDGGDTWTLAGSPKPPNIYALSSPPDDPNTVVAMGQGGALYRSSDGGANWGAKGTPTPVP